MKKLLYQDVEIRCKWEVDLVELGRLTKSYREGIPVFELQINGVAGEMMITDLQALTNDRVSERGNFLVEVSYRMIQT